MSIQGFKEKPLLGWGQDNFPYVFAKYHDPHMYGQEPWFDRSHNVFFDWLIAAGALGLLSHLALYGVAAYLTLKTRGFSKGEKSLIYGVLIAQFVNNLFIFDNLASYILFFALLAYISVVYAEYNEKPYSFSIDSVKGFLIPALGVFAVVLSVQSVILPYFANTTALRGMQQYRGEPLQVMITKREAYESALSLGHVGMREMKEQLVSSSVGVSRSMKNRMVQKLRLRLLKKKINGIHLSTL